MGSKPERQGRGTLKFIFPGVIHPGVARRVATPVFFDFRHTPRDLRPPISTASR